jgi:DNA-binding GntR family transcriptional regulator
VYGRLREAILAGELAPGTRVVPEEVARSMGVSRTPVVQALDRLARESLLETLPNGRVVVAGVSEQAARELLEIRVALEAYAGRLAASRGLDPDTLARLRALNAEMQQEVERLPHLAGGRRARAVERVIALNEELHHHIDVASGNQRLLRLLGDTLDLSAAQPVLLACSDEELARGVAQHALAIEALARRDPDAVERVLREHLTLPLSGVLPRLASRGAPSNGTGPND